MSKTMKILVPVDFDTEGNLLAPSEKALSQALQVAKRAHCEITVCHVVNSAHTEDAIASLKPQSPYKARLRQISEKLNRIIADSQVPGCDIAGTVQSGSPWQTLLWMVQENKFDLVIVGARDRNAMGRTMFGRVASRMLRYCPCPVWTVSSEAGGYPQNILVAHDLTESGSLALKQGAQLAQLHNAKLHVLHVLELPASKRFLGNITHAELGQAKANAIETINQECAALGVASDVSVRVSEGSAHARILEFLGSQAIDLLCMGSVARSGLAGVITGNTAESVFPWIACSLLVVKPESFQSQVHAVPGGNVVKQEEVSYS